jgi:site-specific DNA-adenine methylase
MRPFFPFYGSKWNIARYYPRPTHGIQVEPFAGGAGYSTFYDCAEVHLVDADPIIVGVWSYLLKATEAEILALPDMPEVGDNVDNYNLPQEAKWLIGFWLNRGSATPKKSRTAYSARTDRAQLNWSPRAKERIASQLPGLAGWQVKEGQYAEASNVEADWFVDPPYGDKGKFYRVGFTDFVNLGEFCRNRRGRVIACEGPGATWLPFQPLGSFKSSKGRAEEFVHISGLAA